MQEDVSPIYSLLKTHAGSNQGAVQVAQRSIGFPLSWRTLDCAFILTMVRSSVSAYFSLLTRLLIALTCSTIALSLTAWP